MLAILSMDAYKNLSEGDQVGNAIVLNVAPQQSGFAAYAYSYNGQTVVSFRGTDKTRRHPCGCL
jgi:hypothetical protein